MDLKFLCLFVVLCAINNVVSATGVVELSDSDFSDNIKGYELALVMFYAPWCGHCKKLKPEFDRAGVILKETAPDVVLAKVDCTEAGKDTCSKHGISGYPTLKIFKYGDFDKDYSGPRDADGIAKYMKSQAGPSSLELATLADFNKFLNANEVKVIGFFKEDSELKSTFTKVANTLRESVSFGHTSSDEIFESEKIKNEGIKLYRPKVLSNKFEPDVVDYTGGFAQYELESFIKNNYHGLVGHRTRNNANDFKSPLIVAYYAVDYVKNPKGTNYWRNRILKVAKSYVGKYNFAISAKDDFQHELNEFGFDYVPTEKPLVFARTENKQKYVLKDEFSLEALELFLSDLTDGKLEPYVKSEEVPDNSKNAVKVAVAKNFNELVLENGKDTLVEFYAPWCGHCKKLAPIYDQLAEKLKDEDVVIVKMDATANDVPPSFEVRGFPTLFWLPKDRKSSPVSYDGGRELDDFIQYIAKHATNELRGYDRNGKVKEAKDEL